MRKVFVYYSDGYGAENTGLDEFFHREDAADFVANRMSADQERTLEQYIVIEGERLDAKPIEVITRVSLESKA